MNDWKLQYNYCFIVMLLENTWLARMVSYIQHSLIACYFWQGGILKFCPLTAEWINTALDSYVDPGLFIFSSTFQCHSGKWCNSFWVLLLQTIKLATWLLGASETIHSEVNPESHRAKCAFFSDFSIQTIFKGRVFFKRKGHANPVVSYIATAWRFSDLTYPEKVVREGPCRDSRPTV